MDVYGGIEGGGTQSSIIFLNAKGDIIGKGKGPASNHLLVGMVECRKRIVDMINVVKTEIGMSIETPLKSLGLYLSGCENEETNQELVRGLMETYPNLSERYAVGSDTEASIGTISRNGGVTCIAGTGSNTVMITEDGTKFQCGGWGFLIGDEGSAWHIAHRAIKYCFDDLDQYVPSPAPSDKIWAEIQRHFQIRTQNDLLAHIYTNFDKTKIAGLCKELATLASNGDALSQHIFDLAGRNLARGIVAVLRRAGASNNNNGKSNSDSCKSTTESTCEGVKSLTVSDDTIRVLCVGSVWLSWHLLKPGFSGYLKEHAKDVGRLQLVSVATTVALGAVYLAADKLAIELPRDYSKNYKEFFIYER